MTPLDTAPTASGNRTAAAYSARLHNEFPGSAPAGITRRLTQKEVSTNFAAKGQKMFAFRVALVGAWVAIMVVTINAISTLGLVDGKVFFTDFSNGWRAQINGDFVIHILLVMAWIAYRERTFPRLLLAVPTVLGSVYLLPYIFVVTYTSQGRFDAFILGNERAGLGAK